MSMRDEHGKSLHSSPLGRIWIVLFTVIGVLLSFSAMAAMVAMVVRIGNESNKVVVVTGQRDPADLREESTEVLRKFDAAAWERGELSASPKSERDEIDALFAAIEQCAAGEDHEKFKELVDFDRLLKRCELTGNMVGWSSFDKRSWRGQMRSTAEAETYWAQVTLAGIVTPQDDANSRVVYAFCDDADSADPAECRFWIARDGDSWKLYDWARLDLGLAESQEWGVYAKYANSKELQGFERWGDLLREADEATARGEQDAAREILRRAELEQVPPEFHDFHFILTAYRWAAIDEMSEAERCYQEVDLPQDTPGAYLGLLTCKRWEDPAAALGHAKQYEEAIGPSPALLELQAQLLTRLNRKKESAQVWQRLLRMKPDHPRAASAFVSSLSVENESAFMAELDRLGEPEQLSVSVARGVGQRDYDRLLMIAKYVQQKAPESASADYVMGLTHFVDGRYVEAARLYHSAFEKEPDDEKRQSYLNDFVNAMAADGKVLEALRGLPDAKPAFEALYYSYDESELALTEEEFRRVVALNREMFPDDLAAMYREGSLEIAAERYVEAERVLREALRADAESEEDTEYYHDSCRSLLTTALFKQGRWKEAYEELGERREQFSAVAQLALYDRRWDVARELLAMHRASDREDPKLHRVEGELAVHEKRWGEAVRHLRQALQGSAEYEQWGLKHQLVDAYVESGRWLDHFRTSDEKGDTFEMLADRFVEDEDWGSMDQLIAEYRRSAPDDLRIVRQEAEVAWHRENYDLYARLAQRLLASDDAAVKGFVRGGIESRLMSALLRTRNFELARQRAVAEQREKNDATWLAKVNAAQGELAEAQRVAMEAARDADSGIALYTDDDTVSIFLKDEFSKLHDEFPVGAAYDAARLLAVFMFDKRQRLDADKLSAAAKELGIATEGAAPVAAVHAAAMNAYALKQGDGVIWLAAGEGAFDERWRLERKDDPLADVLKKTTGWIAVGTAGLTERDRKQVEAAARRLGARLVGDRALAAYVAGPSVWEYAAVPMSAELISEWQASGRVKSSRDAAVPLKTDEGDDVAKARGFERAVREAVRAFEESGDAGLEVVWYVSANPRIDPLRLRVVKVKRTYGSLAFEGVLVNDSLLVPQLRTGLPMRFDLMSIQEARLGDQEPVRRRETRGD